MNSQVANRSLLGVFSQFDPKRSNAILEYDTEVYLPRIGNSMAIGLN